MSLRIAVTTLPLMVGFGCATGSQHGQHLDAADKASRTAATTSTNAPAEGRTQDGTDPPFADGNGGKERPPASFAEPPPPGTRATCAVSGDIFTVPADSDYSEYQGRYYVFCCSGCKPHFDANPAKYATGS